MLIFHILLQGKVGGKHNITKNVDLTKTFENALEEKLIHNNPILSAVIKNHLQSYDPRSPTQDFDRTPIVLSTHTDDKQKLRQDTDMVCASPYLQETSVDDLHNGLNDKQVDADIIPKNLCDGFYDLTLDDTLRDTEEPLGCSTASQEAIEKDISIETKNKPTMLLETNFDYIEKNSMENNSNDQIDNSIQKSSFEVLENDPRSPSVGIERTPIVVSKMDGANVEDLSDDVLIKALQHTNADFRYSVSKTQKAPDGILIYEDEFTTAGTETPRKSMPEANSGCRTPLSCMKNKGDTSHIRSKSANTLLDPTTAPPKRVSHIPRLKALAKPLKYSPSTNFGSLKSIKTSAISGDCENTPPHSHRDVWDKDNSVVL